MGKTPERRKESQKKYLQKKKMITFLLDKEIDDDIIDYLDKQDNRSRTIRRALALYMRRQKK
jgi:hypothetical protein